MFNTISMIGLGYIGLPTATLFASRKKHVIGVDISQHAVDTINRGEIHIVEPELDILVQSVVSQGYLKATTKPEPADVFLIAVPTPFIGEHKPDVSYVKSAAQSIAAVLKKGDLVVLESTSPVGTTEQLSVWLAEFRPDLTFPHQQYEQADVQLAYCPERVLPGKVVKELVENDRVIGGMTDKATEMAKALYKIFVQGELIATNARTAEMCKLTENSYRDVNIAFANELSLICDKLDINVWELIKLANHHPRVNILQPGAGVGGHCIAVDPWFIVDKTPEEARLIRTAREVNDHKPHWVVEKVKSAITDVLVKDTTKKIADVKVACLGLSFKPDIDDLRESPAVEIVLELAKLGCQLLVVEPNITNLPNNLKNENISLCEIDNSIQKSDFACILVPHKEFKENLNVINQVALIDCVGLFALGGNDVQ